MSPVISPSATGPLLVATKHLTAAQILAIAGTPVAVVPAPAANEIIFPLARLYRYKFGGQAYDSDPGFSLAWQSNLGNTFGVQSAPLLNQLENAYDGADVGAVVGGADSDPTGALGSALMIVSPAAVFAPPLGNGTLDVTIHYLKETLS